MGKYVKRGVPRLLTKFSIGSDPVRGNGLAYLLYVQYILCR